MRAAGGSEGLRGDPASHPAASATDDEAMEWRRLLHSVVALV